VVGRSGFALERYDSPRHRSHVAQLFSLGGLHTLMPFVYTERGQYMAVTLAALHEMRGVHTKLQTIAYIEKMGWLDLKPEDWESYETHKYEAIWHTQIAFARQPCIKSGLMLDHHERDSWQISPLGIERLLSVREKFRTGVYNVSEGHLWSLVFKKWLRPDYEPSAFDIYEFV